MLQFGLIEANGLDLTVRRDSDRRLWVMGQSLSQNTATNFSQEEDASGLRWLTMQRRVIFRAATVLWVDQSRGAPALALRHVTLTLGSHDRTHVFSLSAFSTAGLGQRLDLRVTFSS